VSPTEGLLSELRLLLGPSAARVEPAEAPSPLRVPEVAPVGRAAP
jgi:hypothetical protein